MEICACNVSLLDYKSNSISYVYGQFLFFAMSLYPLLILILVYLMIYNPFVKKLNVFAGVLQNYVLNLSCIF